MPPFVVAGFGRAGREAREIIGGLAPGVADADVGSSIEARMELRYFVGSVSGESEGTRDGEPYIHSE